MKQRRVITAVILMLAMLLPTMLAGCGGDEVQQPTKARVTNVYHSKMIDRSSILPDSDFDGGNAYIQEMYFMNGTIYLVKRVNNWETGEERTVLCSMTEDGLLLSEQELKIEAPMKEDWDLENEDASFGGHVNRFELHESGRILAQTYAWYSSEMVYEENTFLVMTDLESNVIAQKPLAEFAPEEEYVYCNHILFIDGNNILANINDRLMILDGNLEKQYEVAPEYGWIENVISLNGTLYVSIFDDTVQGNYADMIKLYVLDVNTRKLVLSENTLPANVDFYSIFAGPGYDFYYKDWTTGVYGYSFATGESTKLLDYVNSDMTSDEINSILVLSPDKFLCQGYNSVTYEDQMLLLTRVPDDQVEERIILRLGCMNMDHNLRKAVLQFNKDPNNNTYRITVDDYSRYAGEDYDYEPAYTKLNNDIISGNVPDIMLLDSEMPQNSYFKKGLFLDLNKLIEEDPDINRSDYLENILDAMEFDGKLYRISPSFYVTTMMGKKSILGDRDGWTMAEMMAFINEHSDVRPFFDMTKEAALRYCCGQVINDFIDPATGRCYFNTEEFKAILAFVNTCSDKSVWDDLNWEDGSSEDFFEDYNNTYRNGTTLLNVNGIYSFRDAWNEAQYTFGEAVTLVGFPTGEGNGSVISTNLQLAISAKSAAGEGAWEFIKFVMSEEYAENIYDLPVNLAALEKQAKAAMTPPEGVGSGDADMPVEPDMPAVLPETEGETVEITVGEESDYLESTVTKTEEEENGFFEGYIPSDTESAESEEPAEVTDEDIMIDLPIVEPLPGVREYEYMTEEEVEEMLAFLRSLHVMESTNDKVFAVIKEEAAAYFAGQKSLDQTVKIIQDKVSIIINE